MPDAIAILHQAAPPPPVGGIPKPIKPSGYRDSGADLACALKRRGLPVVTSGPDPDPARDEPWSFPDTVEGIQRAADGGAKVLWANTVLYSGHALEGALTRGLRVIGQPAGCAGRYDDKALANSTLAAAGLGANPHRLVGRSSTPEVLAPEALRDPDLAEELGGWPLVLKPVRGRGSQGVVRISDPAELLAAVDRLTAARWRAPDGEEYPAYGEVFMLEPFLEGEECTITVLPPGSYTDGHRQSPWALPAVRRSGQVGGIMPYSGEVPVSENSEVWKEAGRALGALLEECEQAFEILGARAAIRVDCRQDRGGRWRLFDVNFKPNMTGPGRPGRGDQEGLVTLAAAAHGWDYDLLVENLARQSWGLETL